MKNYENIWKKTLNFLNQRYIHLFKNNLKYVYYLISHIIIFLNILFTCHIININ